MSSDKGDFHFTPQKKVYWKVLLKKSAHQDKIATFYLLYREWSSSSAVMRDYWAAFFSASYNLELSRLNILGRVIKLLVMLQMQVTLSGFCILNMRQFPGRIKWTRMFMQASEILGKYLLSVLEKKSLTMFILFSLSLKCLC